MKGFGVILVWLFCAAATAVEVIPPVPDHYFNDYAAVVSPSTAAQLDRTLEDFERRTSEQIVVAVFPKMSSDSSVEDYTVRVARAWKVGQKIQNNGAVLFVFVQDHKIYLQTGYGLEGVLPDALCKRIIEEQIVPRFKAGDFEGGLTAGVQAILAAAQGEYRGSGRTNAEQNRAEPGFVAILFPIILAGLFLFFFMTRFRSASSGWILTGGGFSGGSWGGGGGFSGGSGSGGGFSSGGGSFGGGGAGGSW